MNTGTRYVGDGRGPVTRGGKKPVTKQGAHGTLYRYRVDYKGTENDPGAPDLAVCVWAYDEEHALEKVTEVGYVGRKGVRVRRLHNKRFQMTKRGAAISKQIENLIREIVRDNHTADPIDLHYIAHNALELALTGHYLDSVEFLDAKGRKRVPWRKNP